MIPIPPYKPVLSRLGAFVADGLVYSLKCLAFTASFASACLAIYTFSMFIEPKIKAMALKPVQSIQKPQPQYEYDRIILSLKNGNEIRCAIQSVNLDSDTITIKWQGGTIAFAESEIASVNPSLVGTKSDDRISIRYKDEITKWWPHIHNPVVRLTNGHIVDGEITLVEQSRIHMREKVKKGGFIRYAFERNQIDRIRFRAVSPEDSREKFIALHKEFPSMGLYLKEMWVPGQNVILRNPSTFSLKRIAIKNKLIQRRDVAGQYYRQWLQSGA